MKTRHKTWLLAATSALALTTAGVAEAQTISQPIPPEHYSVDARGVDMVSGYFNFQTTEVAIGQPGQGGLSLTRGRSQLSWRDSNQGSLEIAGSTYIVVFGLQSEVFTLSGSTFTPKSNSGATLSQSGGTFTFTTSTGTVAKYSTSYCFTATGAACSNRAALYEITEPNGQKTTYNYVTQSYARSIDSNGNPVMGTVARLQSITNNRGYQLHYVYKSNAMNTGGTVTNRVYNWLAVASVTGVNNAIDYCAPTAFNCTYTRTWPSVSYTSAIGTLVTAATDQSGRTTQYLYGSPDVTQLTGIRFPGSTANDITVNEPGPTNRVSSVTDATGTWNYTWTDSGTTRTAVASGPLGQSQTVVTDLTVGRPATISNALGDTLSYQYDSQGRLTRATQPEGDYVEVTYDTRGNVTQTRAVAKPGSGLTDIVTSAAYATSCANPVICNLPTSTTDANGGVTDYTWDSVHGGMLTMTAPAPSTGADRPETRIIYAAQTAQYKNSAGTIVAAPSAVTLPIEVSACATGASCDGGANEVLTTLAYGSSGVANNLLPSSVSRGSGANPAMAVSAMTYTPNGDLETVDGPLSGAGDTTRYRYDAARQMVGVVGPDPDGAGPGLNRAQRITRNTRGAVTLQETGTTAGYSDTDWSNFDPILAAGVTYDAFGRPIEQRQMSDAGAVSGVQQTTYDAAGRASCSAVRMNPATYGALPSSACTSATEGEFGPDRISQVTYDAAGRPSSTTSALGQPNAVTESVTYTDNGRTASLTDGRGNVSMTEYDGFDRPSKLRYPNATGGGTSTTDYEQINYDAVGRISGVRNRAGDTTSLGYDNLNRTIAVNAPGSTPDISSAYDNLGRMTVTGNGTITVVIGWDALSRPVSEGSSVIGAMEYQYDAAGNLTRIEWPDDFGANYTYDLYGGVTAISQQPAGGSATQVAAYGWNNLGQPVSTSRAGGSGVSTARSYDAWGRLSSLSHDATGTTNDVALGFSYNPAGQIVGRTVSNEAYVYGASPTGSTTYAVDGLNQLDSIDSVAVAHDSRGNVTGALGNTWGYDDLNRLTSANAGAGASSFTFDPVNRLATSTAGGASIRRQYVGDQLVAEYNPATGGMLKRYIPGLGLDDVAVAYDGSGTSTRNWQLADERGSVIALSGSTGAVSNINTYDEYGVPGSSNTGRFQYTGQQWLPEAGAYHYRARAYLPQIGRFLQTDPVRYQAGSNLYAYVGAEPINRIDPSGLDWFRTFLGYFCSTTTVPGQPELPPETSCRSEYAFIWLDLFNFDGGDSGNGGSNGGESPSIGERFCSAINGLRPGTGVYATGQAVSVPGLGLGYKLSATARVNETGGLTFTLSEMVSTGWGLSMFGGGSFGAVWGDSTDWAASAPDVRKPIDGKPGFGVEIDEGSAGLTFGAGWPLGFFKATDTASRTAMEVTICD